MQKKNMKTFKILLVCCGVLSLVGCKVLCPPAERIVIHDSTETVVHIHDTILYSAPASVTGEIALSDLIIKEKFTPVKKTYKHATLIQKVVNDTLVSTCLCDTAAIRAQYRDIVTTRLRSEFSKVTLPPVEVRYIPTWVKWLAYIGGFWIIIAIGWLIIRVCKWFYGGKSLPF